MISSLSGCNKLQPQEQVIASGEMTNGYIMNIVLSEERRANGIYKHYSSVVVGQDDVEKSTLDINNLLESENLSLGKGTLYACDYNGDGNQEVAIGTPDKDMDGMYRYAIISVDKSGNQIPLEIDGYKEKGYLYSINSGHYASLTMTKSANGEYTIFVGIKEREKVIPAQYVWTGDQFSFLVERPYIISIEKVPDYQNVYLAIEQTEFLNPMKATDPQFDIYKSYILGNFDAVIYKNSKEISRLNLNSLFGEAPIGWAGPFTIIFNDYNADGLKDFAIGQPVEGSADFKYAILTISGEGALSRLNARGYKEEGFIYNSNETPEFKNLPSPEIGVSVVLSDNGWMNGAYVWDNTEQAFLFSEN